MYWQELSPTRAVGIVLTVALVLLAQLALSCVTVHQDFQEEDVRSSYIPVLAQRYVYSFVLLYRYF